MRKIISWVAFRILRCRLVGKRIYRVNVGAEGSRIVGEGTIISVVKTPGDEKIVAKYLEDGVDIRHTRELDVLSIGQTNRAPGKRKSLIALEEK